MHGLHPLDQEFNLIDVAPGLKMDKIDWKRPYRVLLPIGGDAPRIVCFSPNLQMQVNDV
ncbi:MAG: hypothetical protein HC880_08950 [Bacteroidia bacterium]|nr:hypothetical protein [Bacteroidia bacterium]